MNTHKQLIVFGSTILTRRLFNTQLNWLVLLLYNCFVNIKMDCDDVAVAISIPISLAIAISILISYKLYLCTQVRPSRYHHRQSVRVLSRHGNFTLLKTVDDIMFIDETKTMQMKTYVLRHILTYTYRSHVMVFWTLDTNQIQYDSDDDDETRTITVWYDWRLTVVKMRASRGGNAAKNAVWMRWIQEKYDNEASTHIHSSMWDHGWGQYCSAKKLANESTITYSSNTVVIIIQTLQKKKMALLALSLCQWLFGVGHTLTGAAAFNQHKKTKVYSATMWQWKCRDKKGVDGTPESSNVMLTRKWKWSRKQIKAPFGLDSNEMLTRKRKWPRKQIKLQLVWTLPIHSCFGLRENETYCTWGAGYRRRKV